MTGRWLWGGILTSHILPCNISPSKSYSLYLYLSYICYSTFKINNNFFGYFNINAAVVQNILLFSCPQALITYSTSASHVFGSFLFCLYMTLFFGIQLRDLFTSFHLKCRISKNSPSFNISLVRTHVNESELRYVKQRYQLKHLFQLTIMKTWRHGVFKLIPLV